MLFDTIENLKLYSSLDSRFDAIKDFIDANDFKTMEPGSYEICDGVKVGISEYEPGAGGDYEYHLEYNDLQYAITGGEEIDVIPTSEGLEPVGYKPDIDFFKKADCNPVKVALDEGTFVFLAPGDAHKPCIKLGSEKIRKAVFKIKI